MNKHLRVSLVLPAYNEAAYLPACLEAIERQTVKPFEVIVIDNNSSDDTARIARSYPFVRVVRERKQGVVHARTRGFNEAKGDIIGRIDVDTLVPENWVASVQEIFADASVDAVSGVAEYYDIALPKLVNSVELYFRRRLANKLIETDSVFLQGANMAMRRKSWEQVRGNLCQKGGMHEDFDLAIHLQELGHSVTFDERLIAKLSARRTDVPYLNFIEYVRMNPHTYALHELDSRKHMYEVVMLVLVMHFPVRMLYRGYDPETGTFQLSRLFIPTEARISPVIAQD